MNGTQILLNQVFKTLGLDGAKVTEIASKIGETVVSFKSQLDRIEANQEAIIKHLNISAPTAEIVYLKKEGTNGTD